MLVYVLNQHGNPLMPCKASKARKLLKNKEAKVIKKEPFTIQLLYGSSGYKQPVALGVDTGSKNIGLSASTEKQELFSSEVLLRTGIQRLDITDLIATRREARRTRRNRKTRYRSARFNNRVKSKHKGWLAPSVEQRINSHFVQIEKMCKILPVTRIIVETASFDIQKIKNPNISSVEYQQGDQMGFWNVREYVLWRDGHECQYCHGKSKDNILNVHHLQSRKIGGDAPNNLITLCETCHKKYHAGEIKLTQKRSASFRDAAFMGIMRWTFFNRLKEKYSNIEVKNTYGYLTKNTRIRNNLPKEHYIDAYCIAGNITAKRLPYYWYQKQIRQHCRQLHDMNPDKGGIRKAFRLHKLPYVLKGFRNYDKVIYNGEKCFIFGRGRSGSFLIKKLDGTIVRKSISYKKLKLFSKRRTYLMEIRKSVSSNLIINTPQNILQIKKIVKNNQFYFDF